MPASYTHQQFGNQVLNKLENTTIKKIINDLSLIHIYLQNNNIAIINDNVEPQPPKVANKSWNC